MARVPARSTAVATTDRSLTGVERAAVLMLALGDEHGAPIWKLLEDDEIREVSSAMASLGSIEMAKVETLLVDFVGQLSAAGALMGNFDSTERLLARFLPKDRVGTIMEEIRGPAGRTMWEKLSNMQEAVLANYLKNEYPQTVAVVLSKIRAEQAGRVLSILPEDFALDVVKRMLAMENVQKDILERVEQTLRSELMSNLSQTSRRDPHEQVAEIFNSFDRQTETRFLTKLDEEAKESADRIKQLMFTFDDLAKLNAAGVQTLLRDAPRDKLAVALKGASQAMRDFFMGNMSSRAAKMMSDDMEALGPVRLKDVDEAQAILVGVAKDLAASGEIVISKNKEEDDFVY
ncbi:flagellar motor switch protein FliG [Methylopila capsulata]|uniref:Flagellar motor switch protein FliG n=1 Tax=Methylopila capsulata TaxID=61654 RepID=A0A9W6MSB6_9HYPH|nr:flagellar motor switch protein FliG [Methylopila capsulata]MBM7850775.1 flagellar motor switch protein FliG [Methylopila capsulata]GLK56069.1 flagellar motor switch protein FliG [Methylopila capsulata]